MKLYSDDFKEIGLWISMIVFLFAIAYLAEGGSSLLIILFTIIFGIVAFIGFFNSTSEFLEYYYYKKRCNRLEKEKQEIQKE